MCGEQSDGFSSSAGTRGSPPRVRGTVPAQTVPSHPQWITPACAGNRPDRRGNCICPKDHPRVCGEQIGGRILGAGLKGSPPRVRGTAFFHRVLFSLCGITPACAGNSSPPSIGSSGGWDHPRVCGEQDKLTASIEAKLGSPPRVRGTGLWKKRKAPCSRITPACAGNRLRGDTATRTQ